MTFAVKDLQNGRIKFVGRAQCRVLDNRDPMALGRIKVIHPTMGTTGFIPYLSTGYLVDVPEPGDLVFVEADGGWETHLVAYGKIVTGEAEAVKVPSSFARIVPTNRGMYSPAGHMLELDDGELPLGAPIPLGVGVRLTTAGGSKFHISEDLTDNAMTLEMSGGQAIKIDSLLDTISLDTAQGQNITLQAGLGISLSSATGDNITLASGSIKINSQPGAGIELGTAGDVTISDVAGSFMLVDSSGIGLFDFSGNAIEMVPSGIGVQSNSGSIMAVATASAYIKNDIGAGMVANGGTVAIGGPSAELLDLFDKTLEQMDLILQGIQKLSVATGVGPSGPPINIAEFIAPQVQLTVIKALLGTIKGSL